MSINSLKSAPRWLATAVLALAATHAHAGEVSKEQQEANRQIVLAFYEQGLNQLNADAAMPYLGERYVQHNPTAPDGPEGFRKFIAFMKEKYPKFHSEIKRSFTDREYVILHVHSVREPGTRGNAIVDIFKVENGKIVEHWDVIQAIPETAANDNTMF
ncbi:nuclear transport factor 2 family protein [Achromobacter aegrifaciens]